MNLTALWSVLNRSWHLLISHRDRWQKSLRKRSRSLQFFALIGLTVLVVSSCNQAPQTGAVDRTAPSSQSTTAERVVKHALGETKVPANPQRVVVLDNAVLDTAITLGVKPVGAALYPGTTSYLGDKTQGIETVGSSPAPPNLEKIVSLKPDLILGIAIVHKQLYDQLSQIAPTVLAEDSGREGNWKQHMTLYAEALGKTEVAKNLLNDYNQQVNQLKQRLGEQLTKTSVSLVAGFQDRLGFYTTGSFPGSILQDVGLPRPPAQEKADIFASQVSREDFKSINGDVIFLIRNAIDPNNTIVDQFKQDPLFSQLDAVKQNRVYVVDGKVWTVGRSILAANRVLDDLSNYLVKQ
ncbi:ABC transporter substrate-binding protein [Myxacorys almedinensis]|uniref:ABC transporter substrate-binding protein n=1 Tax=Myxacorys almedinensis A TaxID=2690445 RepID=A0A8J7ZAI8_9CYAN|nr:iron-siderophore ABC transporter substrate-binding protein [Myxacorys almedinensis]NDJ18420.1 ABC transporter substrate-binding protein [Myxacorys almedinensis A]